MKSAILALILGAGAATAQADFDGAWSGVGILFDSQGNQTECSEVSFEIRQKPSALNLEFGYARCSPHEINFEPTFYSIHVGHLVLGGKVVGDLSEKAASLDYVDHRGIHLVAHATLNDQGQLSFTESALDANGQMVWALTSLLDKRGR